MVEQIQEDTELEHESDQPDDSEGAPCNANEPAIHDSSTTAIDNNKEPATGKPKRSNVASERFATFHKAPGPKKPAREKESYLLKYTPMTAGEGARSEAATRAKKRWDDPEPASKFAIYSRLGKAPIFESKEIMRAKRRARVRELMVEGRAINYIAKEVGAGRETIYNDITIIGVQERTWTKKPGFLFGKLSTNYSLKITALRKELSQAMDACDVVSIVEAMEKVDRGWIEFLFRSGTIEQSLGKMEVEHVMKQAREEITIFQEVVMTAFREHPDLWAQVKPQLEMRMAAMKARQITEQTAIDADVDDNDSNDDQRDELKL